jgi:hypothetical protein
MSMTTDKSGPDLGRYLYSIAVIADTHMNEEEYGSASPYECNRVANARTRWVINRIMTSTNPAEEFRDDLANANRVAEALLATLAVAGRGPVDVFVDTFADIDRGYFVRNGLVDRRYNPRLGSHVVKNLYGALNASAKPLTSGGSHDVTSARICTVEVDGDEVALVLPQQKVRVDRVPANRRDAGSGTARRIDLETGRVSRVRWRRVG